MMGYHRKQQRGRRPAATNGATAVSELERAYSALAMNGYASEFPIVEPNVACRSGGAFIAVAAQPLPERR